MIGDLAAVNHGEQHTEISTGLFFNKKSKIKFATRAELKYKTLIPSKLLAVPVIKNKIASFKSAHNTNDKTQFVKTAISISGKLTIIEVPQSVAVIRGAQILVNIKCKCDDHPSGGSCTANTAGTICNNECGGICTLSTGSYTAKPNDTKDDLISIDLKISKF